MSEFHLRDIEQRDLNFIVNSWLKSYRASCPLISDGIFYRGQKALILNLLQTETVRIAADPQDFSHIFGWAVVSRDGMTLHYVYIKQSLRGYGLARSLAEGANTVSHLTPPAIKYMSAHPGKFTFDPYASFQIKEQHK